MNKSINLGLNLGTPEAVFDYETHLNKNWEIIDEQLAQTAKVINVKEMFGAIGDRVANDTQNIKNAINYASSFATIDWKPTLIFPDAVGYLVTEGIVIPPNINVIMEAPIVYSSNGEALVIGENGNANTDIELKLNVRRETTSNWSDENNVGITLINTTSSKIHIVNVSGFTVGLLCFGSKGGFAYNKITLGNIRDNHKGVVLSNESVGGTGWCNENLFLGGRFWCATNTNTNTSRFGVVITSKDGIYVNNNNNVFFKPSFELRVPTSGQATPVLVEHGDLNSFLECRNEANTVPFAYIENQSIRTEITTGYGSAIVIDNSFYPSTYSAARRDMFRNSLTNLVFDSGSLRDKTCHYSTDRVNIAGMFLATSTAVTTHNNLPNITRNQNTITLANNRGVGIRIDTSAAKKFVVRRGGNCRVNIRCFDANMNNLYDINKRLIKGTVDVGISANSGFGGVYRTGVSNVDCFFTVDEEVKFIEVILSEGEISRFTISTNASGVVLAINPFGISHNVAETVPTTGSYPLGLIMYNVNPTVGQPIGWINTQNNGANFIPMGTF